MSIEVGGTFGVSFVWRQKDERWQDDCVGAKKKQGPTVMCWGMIGWGWKGPFHIWDSESKEEREKAKIQIASLNQAAQAKEDQLNRTWQTSPEWKELRQQELQAARELRQQALHTGEKVKTVQSWWGKKFKIYKLKRGEGKGVDSWRYVTKLARPILWPECKRRLADNPSFILVEDNAACHDSDWTNQEREAEGISKVDWPPNSPDFNPIEKIWTLMKRQIQRRRGLERITTVGQMKSVRKEEWEKITIAEINAQISLLPKTMVLCIKQAGYNKFHA